MQDDTVTERENVDHYYFTEHSTFSRGCCALLLSCFGGDQKFKPLHRQRHKY